MLTHHEGLLRFLINPSFVYLSYLLSEYIVTYPGAILGTYESTGQFKNTSIECILYIPAWIAADLEIIVHMQ